MYFILLIIFGFKSVSGTFYLAEPLEKYTSVATTVDGFPCLGGCSAITNKCVVNLLLFSIKKPCLQQNKPAPIYYTSQIFDKNSKICLSNCGRFGRFYEWCITDTNNYSWDYCSSHVRGDVPTTGRTYVDSYTKHNLCCNSACLNNYVVSGYRCSILGLFRHPCAKQAISRIPTLPSDYQVGTSSKLNCNGYMTHLLKESFTGNVHHFDTETVPDNYLSEIADTIETSVRLAQETGQFRRTTDAGNAIKSYTMINMVMKNGNNAMVPAVIRAIVSNSTIKENQIKIEPRMGDIRKRRKRQWDEDEYNNWRIIDSELGGPDSDYNYVRQSANLYETWWKTQRAVINWCKNTGGYVGILIVVFYPDVYTPTPRAIGTAVSFYNPDGTELVSCKDKLYWNR